MTKLKTYFCSPLREKDRLYTEPVKQAIKALGLQCYWHDHFAERLDRYTKGCDEYNKIAEDVANIEIEEMNNTDIFICCIPPDYAEITQGVGIELGIARSLNKPIILFISKDRPIDNISLLIRFYQKLKICYIDDDNIESDIKSFIEEL